MAAKNQVAPAARILRPTLACLRQPRVGHPPSQLSPFAVLAVCQDNNTSPPTMRPLMCFKRENAKSGYFPFRHGRLRTSRFPSFSTCVFLSTPTERATRALGHLRPYLSSHLSTIHLFTLWLPDMKTTVLPRSAAANRPLPLSCLLPSAPPASPLLPVPFSAHIALSPTTLPLVVIPRRRFCAVGICCSLLHNSIVFKNFHLTPTAPRICGFSTA